MFNYYGEICHAKEYYLPLPACVKKFQVQLRLFQRYDWGPKSLAWVT